MVNVSVFICTLVIWPDYCSPARRPRGLILHGPHGNGLGKKLFIEAMMEGCNSYNPKVAALVFDKYSDRARRKTQLAKLFDSAQKLRPSVVILDNFEGLVPPGSRIVRFLGALMDALDDHGSVLIVAITDQLDLVDPELRKSGRFDKESSIDLPDLEARLDKMREEYKETSSDLQPAVKDEAATETFATNDESAPRCSERAPTLDPMRIDCSQEVAEVNDAQEEGNCDEQNDASGSPANVSEEEELAKDSANQTTDEQSKIEQTDRKIQIKHVISKIGGGLKEVLNTLWTKICFKLQYTGDISHLQITPSKGLILHGPSGVGKTMLIEGLYECCSYSSPKIAAYVENKYSDDINQQLYLKGVVCWAQKLCPTVIFLDNFHDLAYRGSPNVPVLGALMDAMKGAVFVVAATDRLDLIDPELRKSGRFKVDVPIELPDLEARADILCQMTLTWNLEPPVIDAVANRTSGADLGILRNKAFATALERTDPNFMRNFVYRDAELEPVDFSTIRVGMEDFKKTLLTVHSTSQQLQNNKSEYLGLTVTSTTKVDQRRRRGHPKKQKLQRTQKRTE